MQPHSRRNRCPRTGRSCRGPTPANHPSDPRAPRRRAGWRWRCRARTPTAARIVDAEQAALVFLSREVRSADTMSDTSVRSGGSVRRSVVCLLVDEICAADPIVSRLAIHADARVERLARDHRRRRRLENVVDESGRLAAKRPLARNRFEVRADHREARVRPRQPRWERVRGARQSDAERTRSRDRRTDQSVAAAWSH